MNKENIFISSPIEYINGKSKYMYPNIARLKGYTYGSCIYCNIGVIFKDNVTNEITIKNFPKINIAKKGLFYNLLKKNNKLGGQHKIPRLSNERTFIEELKKMNN